MDEPLAAEGAGQRLQSSSDLATVSGASPCRPAEAPLALDPDGAALAARLAAAGQLDGAPAAPAPSAPRSLGSIPGVFVHAANTHRCVEVLYAGEGAAAGRRSVIQPHGLVAYGGRIYVHAWEEDADGWRLFRLDRFLDALPTERTFTRRNDFDPVTGRSGLFRAPAAAVEHVRVRFSPRVARWIRERYPRCEPQDDGGVIVTFLATSVEWLVRRVLEYGPDAEVLGPGAYREAVRRAVA